MFRFFSRIKVIFAGQNLFFARWSLYSASSLYNIITTSLLATYSPAPFNFGTHTLPLLFMSVADVLSIWDME